MTLVFQVQSQVLGNIFLIFRSNKQIEKLINISFSAHSHCNLSDIVETLLRFKWFLVIHCDLSDSILSTL